MGSVDLHIHTTASDGTFTPAEIAREAGARGLVAIAITDHDTTAGLDEALEAAKATALKIVPGIELSAELGSEEVHILGYYLAHHDRILNDKLDVLRRARRDRARKMVERLRELGMPLEWDRVEEIAQGSSALGRPHVAYALEEKGYVSSFNEAFDLYIGVKRPAYVPRYKLTPVEAIAMIIAAEGLPVLAHPWGQERFLPELVEAGLVGLEAYYPSHTTEQTELLVRLSERYGLVPTGGSDFHGYGRSVGDVLGMVSVPMKSLRRLSALAMNRASTRG